MTIASSQEDFNATKKFFQAKRFCDIVISPCLKTQKLVLHHRFCRKKKNRNLFISFSYTPCHHESIFFWKHYIENTKVKRILMKCCFAIIAILTKCNVISFQTQVIFDHITETGII